MEQITLFDLPSKGRCASWSPNPLKTRLVLNFKDLEYKTEWLEFPDIAPKLKGYGTTPNENAPSDYTVPTIVIATANSRNEVLMDSKKIANALEVRYPHPSLHLESSMLPVVDDLVMQVLKALMPIFVARIATNLLNNSQKKFGKSPAELEKERGGQGAWNAAKPAIERLAEVLKTNDEGPYVLGRTISYADFYILSALHFCNRLETELFDKLVSHDPAFSALYNAGKPLLVRDD